MNGQAGVSGSQTLPNIKVIWIAMVGATVAMALVVEVWRFWQPGFSGFVGDGLPLETIRYALIGVALLIAVVAFVLRRRLPPQPDAVRGQALDAAALRQQAQKRFALSLVVFALVQDIALLGLVLFLLDGERMDFYLFALPSFFMLLSLRPGSGVRVV